MLAIFIFKWIFVITTIGVGAYHYKLELNKLNKIARAINDPKLLSELKSAARTRMIHFFLLFAAFIIWIMSYDIEIENVTREKAELANELEKVSQTYADSGANQDRLINPKATDQNIIEDIRAHYTDIFVNYYVMRNCNLAGNDDAFVINSAMIRELSLNHVPLALKDEILMDAKQTYLQEFSKLDCTQVKNTHKDIISNYNNYIATSREVLKATF